MEPQDTIETVFLGSSVIANGIIPAEIYDEAGVCAYNLGTEQQPMLASYYWLKEVYRLHSNTLKTVVLDASMLRRVPEKAFYQKAIDNMAFSMNKIEAINAYTANGVDFLNHFIALFEYHERWTEIKQTDFQKTRRSVVQSNRGYNYLENKRIDYGNCFDLAVGGYYLNTHAEKAELNDEAVYYFDQMVRFCQQHQMKLILIKTPIAGGWEDSWHMAAAALAKMNSLDYIDFNYTPVLDELGFDYGSDLADDNHMNHNGAVKLSRWFGRYLKEQCENRDVRGMEGYTFLGVQLADYRNNMDRIVNLKAQTDVTDFIEKLMQPHWIAFISVKDESANSLTDEQRVRFSSLGLPDLSSIGYRDSYIAVIEDGCVIKEMMSPCSENQDAAAYIRYSGKTKDNESYYIKSGGLLQGNCSSIMIEGEEYSPDMRGINIVVYDKERKRIVDTSAFDTFASPLREGDIVEALQQAREAGTPYNELSERVQKAWMYDRRYENSKYQSYWELFCKNDQLFEYLSPYVQNRDYVIYISVQDEAAGTFDATVRERFREMGLVKLSELEYRDSYIGVIDDGKVYYEQSDHGERPITYDGIIFKIVSGGCESGNCSSIFIQNKDYSPHSRGLNIVVYDKALQRVIRQTAFDTYATPIGF